MAGAAVPIGAIASIGGLNQFLAGLTAVGSGFNVLAQQSKAVAPNLEAATAGFAAFNTASRAVGTSLDAIGTAFGTALVPVAAVGTAIAGLAEISEEAGSRTVTALAGVGTATAALGVGGVAGIAAFGAALSAVFGASLAVTARFQREVVDLGAITQESPSNIGALTESVKDLARQFATSIPDIQSAGLELVRAGIPMQVVSDGALALTLALEQLSKGEISAGAAAEGLGSILTVFQNSLSETGEVTVQGATRVANAITGIANATRAGIPEVITAFAKVGPTAQDMGETVETTAAALGLLLKAGLKGEEAGTALRNFFIRLQNPADEAREVMARFNISLFDVDGNSRSYITVLGDLIDQLSPAARAISGISDETAAWATSTIFQTRALTATKLAMAQGTAEYEHFLEIIRQTNVLDQAARQMDALLRQISRFRNIVELAGIAFGTDFVQGLSAATRSVNDFLVQGQRLERLAGALGAGAIGIITGRGAETGAGETTQSPESFNVASTFGQEAAASLALVTVEAGRVLASFGEVLGAAGRFRDVLVQIAFPQGIDPLVSRVGDALVQASIGVQAFLDFLGQIAPVGANAFGTAVRGVVDFLGRLKDVVTAGLEAEDVADTFTRLGELARITAGAVEGIGLAMARFIRAVIDNRDVIIGFATGVIQVFSQIAQSIINLTTLTLNFVGVLGRAADFFGRVMRNQPTGTTPQAIPGGINVGRQPVPAAFAGAQASGEVTTEIERQIGALEELGRSWQQSQEAATSFFGALGGGQSEWDDLIESFRTGRSVVQQQIDAIEELQNVVARGAIADLSGFLGARRIPQEIRDAIAEVTELRANIHNLPWEESIAGAERLQELLDFIAASAGVAKDQLIAANLASAATDRGGATGPPSRFDPTAAAREQKKALEDVQRAQERIAEFGEDTAKGLRTAQRQFDTTRDAIVQRWADGMESLITSHRDAMADIEKDERDAQNRLLDNFLKTQRRQEEDITRGRADEAARTGFEQGLENERIIRQHAAEDRETDAQRGAAAVLRVEQQTQEEITRVRQQGIDNANTVVERGIERTNTVFQRGQEEQLRILNETNERATQALTRQFEVANTTRGRGREDTTRQRDLARDLAKAGTAEERRQVQERFAEETQALTRRRGEEDADRQIRLQQENALQTLRKQQELQVIQFRRSQEDGATARRQGQEDAATNRRRAQEVETIQFRQRLETEMIAFVEGQQNGARDRQRTAAQQALAEQRADAAASLQFTQDQQDRLREEVTRPRAVEDLGESLVENERRANERRDQANATFNRGRAAQERTVLRELNAAYQSHVENRERAAEDLRDKETDIYRQIADSQRALGELLLVAPESEKPKIQETLNQLQGVGGAYQRYAAQAQAANAASLAFARQGLAETRAQLGGLQEEAQPTIAELLAELERIRQGGQAPIILTPELNPLGLPEDLKRIEETLPSISLDVLPKVAPIPRFEIPPQLPPLQPELEALPKLPPLDVPLRVPPIEREPRAREPEVEPVTEEREILFRLDPKGVVEVERKLAELREAAVLPPPLPTLDGEIGALRVGVDDAAIRRLREDIQQIRDVALGGEIVIRTFVHSPQADTMIALLRAIERNTAEPGSEAPLIGEINLTAPTEEAAEEVGIAVREAVRFVGGNA